MEEVVDLSVSQRRFQLILMTAFAASTLLVASLGIYGVVSYSVARRRNEVGIRMALGAQRSQLLGLIIRQGMVQSSLAWPLVSLSLSSSARRPSRHSDSSSASGICSNSRLTSTPHAILFGMRKMTRKIIVLSFACGMIAGMFAEPLSQMAKQFLNLDGKHPPGYSHVVISAPGKMIFISGRGGVAHDGKMPADFKSQAKNTFEDLKRCLALAGASFKDVVKINYYVANLANTDELRAVRAEYLDMKHPPAATLVQAGLGGDALV
jgi:enamine deaminase RidA (YjgF/YER057c/UK114 family)